MTDKTVSVTIPKSYFHPIEEHMEQNVKYNLYAKLDKDGRIVVVAEPLVEVKTPQKANTKLLEGSGFEL